MQLPLGSVPVPELDAVLCLSYHCCKKALNELPDPASHLPHLKQAVNKAALSVIASLSLPSLLCRHPYQTQFNPMTRPVPQHKQAVYKAALSAITCLSPPPSCSQPNCRPQPHLPTLPHICPTAKRPCTRLPCLSSPACQLPPTPLSTPIQPHNPPCSPSQTGRVQGCSAYPHQLTTVLPLLPAIVRTANESPDLAHIAPNHRRRYVQGCPLPPHRACHLFPTPVSAPIRPYHPPCSPLQNRLCTKLPPSLLPACHLPPTPVSAPSQPYDTPCSPSQTGSVQGCPVRY